MLFRYLAAVVPPGWSVAVTNRLVLHLVAAAAARELIAKETRRT